MLQDVLRIKQPWTLRGPDESRESFLSSHRRSNAYRMGSTLRLKKLVELAHALRIEANYFAVENRTEALPFLRLPRGPGSGHGA